MSYGWFFVILWCITVIGGVLGILAWMRRPEDEYERLLEKLEKEEGVANGN